MCILLDVCRFLCVRWCIVLVDVSCGCGIRGNARAFVISGLWCWGGVVKAGYKGAMGVRRGLECFMYGGDVLY